MIRLLRSYVFWTYERGSLHYDVMVTLILLFLFISPHIIDFHDRPIPEVPQRSSEVLVRTDTYPAVPKRFVYEIRVDDLRNVTSPAELDTRVARVVNTIAGPEAQVESVKPVTDPHGNVVAYDAIVRR